MAIQLPPDIEASTRQRVERGRFSDAGAVIREALRRLDEHERQVDTLRAKLQVRLDELDRGEGVEWTLALMEQPSREADEMFCRGEQPDPDVCP